MAKTSDGAEQRRYRVMWDQNAGQEMYYNPPISPQRVAQATFGFFEGRPVDAYVGAMGSNAGFTVGWPTKVENAEFIVDRLQRGRRIGDIKLWRHAEQLRLAFEAGIDFEQVKVEEARRLGVDFFFRLGMNDWHHLASEADESNLWSGDFFAERPELWIGDEGARGWPEKLWNVLRFFQDFAHEEVRNLRRDLAIEACERYEVDGFLFDFMRCPGYFKRGAEEAGMPLMTELLAQTRDALRRIGSGRGRSIRFAVRVPNTIGGSERLGLDVRNWVKDGLVDIVVPSSFFAQDMEEDVGEWVDLVSDTPVQLYPAIEEGYAPGHTGNFNRWYFQPPVMSPMSNEMLRGIAARHHARGVDGIYTFNFFGSAPTYDYDNREAVDDVADPIRLQHKDKVFVVMRSHASFPNCLVTEHQLPLTLSTEPAAVTVDVPDDLRTAADRLALCRLRVHLTNVEVYDGIEVSLNGAVLECSNPIEGGEYRMRNGGQQWLEYDLQHALPGQGSNEIGLRLTARLERLAAEFDITVEDIELELRYEYPNGAW